MGAEADPRYVAAWADERKRDRSGCLACGVVVLLPPLAVVLLTCNAMRLGADPPFGMFFYGIHLMLAFAVAAPLGVVANLVVGHLRMRGFRCPRCGERFHQAFFLGLNCQHCGLPCGALSDPHSEKEGG